MGKMASARSIIFAEEEGGESIAHVAMRRLLQRQPSGPTTHFPSISTPRLTTAEDSCLNSWNIFSSGTASILDPAPHVATTELPQRDSIEYEVTANLSYGTGRFFRWILSRAKVEHTRQLTPIDATFAATKKISDTEVLHSISQTSFWAPDSYQLIQAQNLDVGRLEMMPTKSIPPCANLRT